MANVELNVRTQLLQIVKELEEIAKASEKVGEGLGRTGPEVGDALNNQVKKTERFLSDLQGMGVRVANQLKNDFKALASINAITGALKLSEVFKGSVKESFSLNDSLRRLSQTFGIADSQRANFQTNLIRGFAKAGMSIQMAGNALQGLSETSVRGQPQLIEYAKAAAQLATLSGRPEDAGGIAKGLAGVVTARGGDTRDLGAMTKARDDVRRIQLATGMGASEVTQAMTDLFSKANGDFQPMLKKGGAVQLATAALMGGKESTGFLERFLGMSGYERSGLEAQGARKVFTAQGGFNLGAIQSILREAEGRGIGSTREGRTATGLTTYGLSPEQAQGFMRLAQALERRGPEIAAAANRAVNVDSEAKNSRGFVDAFKGNVDQIRAVFEPLLNTVSEGGANLLNKTSGNPYAAGGVVASGAILAAVLASAGLKGVGGALGIGARGAASGVAGGALAKYAGATPVWVVNASQIGGGGALGGLPGLGGAGAGIAVGTAAAALGVGAGVVYAGMKNEAALEKKALAPLSRVKEKVELDSTGIKDLAEQLNTQIQIRNVTPGSGGGRQDVRVVVEPRTKDFKAGVKGSTGVAW